MARRGKLHYAWVVAAITFLSLLVAAGLRSTPGVLIVPLEAEFHWSRATISFAIGLNIFLYGLIGPFAAALMDRFGLRRTMLAALALITAGVALTPLMTRPWQLILLWGVVVGIGSGSTALVLGATVVARWFATRRGLVKKTDLMQYSSPRPSGLIAIALEEGDEVVGVRLTDGKNEVILSTAEGQAIRFEEEEVRPMGRSTYGVRGMTLDEGDQLVSIDLVESGASLLAVAEKGYGKRTEMEEYRQTHRGGKGIITMKTTDKTGRVIGIRMVTNEDQIMLVSSGGKVVRIRVNEIRVIGRNTQGVRLIDLEDGERVAAVARLAEREDDSEASEPTLPPEPSDDGTPDA